MARLEVLMSDFVLASRSTGPNVTDYALASFLARCRGSTLRAYKQDLLAFLRWCAARQLAPLEAKRPHLELYLRWMEQEQLAQATIGRRFGTVAGFFRYAVVDGHVADNPALAVTRPRVSWEGQRRASCTPSNTQPCSPQTAMTDPKPTPSSRSWGCSAYASVRRAAPISPI